MSRWCCGELEFPFAGVSKLTFSCKHDCNFRGRAYTARRLVTVRLNPLTVYPLKFRNKRALPAFELADAVEAVVYLTAHEIGHVAFPDRTEQSVERLGRRVTRTFRERRSDLTARWGDPGPGPVHAGKVHRWECRRCGRVSRSARPRTDPTRRSCGSCFQRWEDAAAQGEFLTYTVE